MVTLSIEEMQTIREALALNNDTLLEDSSNINSPRKLVSFMSVFQRKLKKDPRSKIEVKAISEAELKQLKDKNVLKTVILMGALIPLMPVTALVGADKSRTLNKANKNNKMLVRVTFVDGKGKSGKTKVALVDSTLENFKAHLKKMKLRIK